MHTIYKGPKPCPGCGKSGQESQRNYADEVCFECSDMIKLGRQAKKEASKGYVRVNAYPFFVDSGKCVDGYNSNGVSESICNAFLDVVRSIDAPTQPTEDSVYIGGYSSNKSVTAIITRAQYESLNTLYSVIEKGIPTILDAGQRKGQNLLFSLNDGSLTLDQFNERLK